MPLEKEFNIFFFLFNEKIGVLVRKDELKNVI